MRGKAAAICFALACLICLAGLAGAIFAVPALSSPLPGSAPVWPPSLIAMLILAAMLLVLTLDNHLSWLHRAAPIIAAALAGGALVMLILSLAGQTRGSPVSCLLVTGLAVSALGLMRRDAPAAPIAALIAALVISFALLILAGQLIGGGAPASADLPWHIPIPTNLAELAIGAGLLLLATQRTLAEYRTEGHGPRPILLRAVPALMVAPALVLAVGLILFRNSGFPASTEIWGMFANTLVVGSVLLWAVIRLARQGSTLDEVRSASADSDQRLILAAKAHRIGIFDMDVPSGQLTWFAGTEPFMGVPEGMLSTFEGWQRAVVPDDRNMLRKRIEAATWAKADQISFFYRLRLPDGAIRAIEGSARCFYDANGQLVRLVGASIDVTDRVEQTSQLAAREAQMRSILETVPSAMVTIDVQGRILSFSPAAERMFGYEANSVIGSSVAILMNDAYAARHDAALARYLRTGERRIIGKPQILSALHADGTEFPIELNVGEAVHEDRRIFTAFITDLSDQLRTEEKLEQLSSELTQIGRINAMGELAAALAHEINQPLAAITNHVATAEMILEDERVPDPLHDRLILQLKSTREQALRAGEIIRRLREFVSRREVDLRVEPVETAIREAVALVLVGSQRIDVSFSYDLAPEAPYMFADKIQIQQVLVNLMRNALEAVRATAATQPSIRVATRRIDDDWIEFSVADNGPGLCPEKLDNLFKPFASTKGQGNMGIGLLICRRIVEAHGGAMSAHNNDAGGATFRFTVPGAGRETGEE
ncbi:PAS domain S-box protein [Sphingomonas sp.]|jgi:PAS domain S-box-containing protein|uniref:PAS domain-containing sensor histidine kinase n=1 Tax=Sphingomonas sp. TaxID=28214 RepID=UPI00307E8A62